MEINALRKIMKSKKKCSKTVAFDNCTGSCCKWNLIGAHWIPASRPDSIFSEIDSGVIMRKANSFSLGWVALLSCFLAQPLQAQQFKAEKVTSPGQIAIATHGVFTIYEPNPETLDERAALIQARLNYLLSTRPTSQIRVGGRPGGYVVLMDNQQLVAVTGNDAHFHNTSEKALAESWANSLRQQLQDKVLLKKHLDNNLRPASIYYGERAYDRSETSLATVTGLKSTGYAQFRKLIFVDASSSPPTQVYLRAASGEYTVYDLHRAPAEVLQERGESVPH
jgi:hypothetical protein